MMMRMLLLMMVMGLMRTMLIRMRMMKRKRKVMIMMRPSLLFAGGVRVRLVWFLGRRMVPDVSFVGGGGLFESVCAD